MFIDELTVCQYVHGSVVSFIWQKRWELKNHSIDKRDRTKCQLASKELLYVQSAIIYIPSVYNHPLITIILIQVVYRSSTSFFKQQHNFFRQETYFLFFLSQVCLSSSCCCLQLFLFSFHSRTSLWVQQALPVWCIFAQCLSKNQSVALVVNLLGG